jgi:hypothetical protein
LVLLAALIIAGAIWWGVQQVVGELRAARDDGARARTLALVELFAPAIGEAQADPRALLAWQPLVKMARQLFPAEYAPLDRTAGGAFPFTSSHAQAAHAQWTADWLAWERTHDAEYKLKAAAAEQELVASGGAVAHRAKLDAIESEKLDLYQRRYAEYVRVSKALQALTNES